MDFQDFEDIPVRFSSGRKVPRLLRRHTIGSPEQGSNSNQYRSPTGLYLSPTWENSSPDTSASSYNNSLQLDSQLDLSLRQMKLDESEPSESPFNQTLIERSPARNIRRHPLPTSPLSRTDGDLSQKEGPSPPPSKCSRLWWWMRKATWWSFVSVAVVALVLVAGGGVRQMLCEHHLRYNVTALRENLAQRVYGQHIAVDIIPEILASFDGSLDASDEQWSGGLTGSPTFARQMRSAKLLTMAFLGWTGIGKNLVGNIIASHVATPHTVRKLIVPLQFMHEADLDSYRSLAKSWILDNITHCAINLFIVDEVEKGFPQVIDGLKDALLDLTSHDLNNTKVIMVLLSNSGAVDINRYVLSEMESGRERAAVNHKDLVTHLVDPRSTRGQYWYQDWHAQGHLHYIVPFMPLERSHVEQCIAFDISYKGLSLDGAMVQSVAEQLDYFPADRPRFSTSGCRKVSSKVDLVLEIF